jgi:hypothetical protein
VKHFDPLAVRMYDPGMLFFWSLTRVRRAFFVDYWSQKPVPHSEFYEGRTRFTTGPLTVY